ncbi:hypothetical protein SCMU_18980 [Sinomonas cyclohexanicum]|uniref:Uncharacterized protein n=1 Tax=Sinomonas cyclohexanicum TaxID=322009 RepID=A0ABN6FGZ0_SINCY|nr:hypothetical protein SCMU_18980 [Corynebacterium cyclohexanicum]
MVADPLGQHKVRVGVVAGDSAEHLERHEAAGVGRPRSLARRLFAEAPGPAAAAVPLAALDVAACLTAPAILAAGAAIAPAGP